MKIKQRTSKTLIARAVSSKFNVSKVLGEEITGKIPLRPIDTMVVVGASIMHLTYENSGASDATSKFFDKGLLVDVYDRANSGDDVQDMIDKAPAIIAEFQDNAANTLVALHGPGNSLATYPTNAELINTGMRTLVQMYKDAGFMLALTTITYREVPPYAHDSQPFNVNIIQAIVDEFADIKMDLYTHVYDNRATWFGPTDDPLYDGVHPWPESSREGNRVYMIDTIAPFIKNVEKPNTDFINDVLIQFGNNDVMVGGLNKAVEDSEVPLYNTDYTEVSGAFATFEEVDLKNNGGRGGDASNPESTELTIYNDLGLEDFSYVVGDERVIKTNLRNAGIDPEATYRVQVTASRATSSGLKTTEYTVGDAEPQISDAKENPPVVLTFTVGGFALKALGVTCKGVTGSDFAYISLMRITKIS